MWKKKEKRKMEEKVCSKCNMKSGTLETSMFHKHHITYDPEAVEILCFRCHGLITEVNTLYRGLVGFCLTNEERRLIYRKFKDGAFDYKPARKNKIKNLFIGEKGKKGNKISPTSFKNRSKLWGFWNPENDN